MLQHARWHQKEKLKLNSPKRIQYIIKLQDEPLHGILSPL